MHKLIMKKFLIILGILLLLVIGVLFVPPIYNRFTKPLFKNTVDAKEWYHQVDCENLTQVRDYCNRLGYSTDYYILVDFSKPSGKKRFFIYNLQRGKRVMSSYCMHGSGKGNTAAQPKFSNNPGSGCTSLGRYIMIGKVVPHCKKDNPKCLMQDAHGKNTFFMKNGLCQDCQKALKNIIDNQ